MKNLFSHTCRSHTHSTVYSGVPPSARKPRLSPTVAAKLKPMKHAAVMAIAVGTILHTHNTTQRLIGPSSRISRLLLSFACVMCVKVSEHLQLNATRSSATAEGPREHAVSVEILSTTAKLYEKMPFEKSLQQANDLQRHSRSLVLSQ